MKKVLLLDDEVDIRLLVGIQLKKRGYQVSKCASLKEAIELISREKFYAYFLDLNLPDGSGFTLVPVIREKNPAAKILVCSAYTNDLQLLEAEYEMKVDFFIGKPIRNDSLAEAFTWLDSAQ